MTLTIEDFDGAVALDTVQLVQAKSGTGWKSGCAASLVDTDDAIRITVASGEVYVENTAVTVSTDTVPLPDGDAQYPRKDIIYADANGLLSAEQGVPRKPKPDGESARETFQPEPPDLKGIAGGPSTVAPIAEVWVPSDAGGASDLSDPTVEYVRDRRLAPWADSVLTAADEGDGNGLDADTVDGLDSAAFLQADGSVPLTGDLNINGHRITNINRFNIDFDDGSAAFRFDAGADSTSGSYLIVQNGTDFSIYSQDGNGNNIKTLTFPIGTNAGNVNISNGDLAVQSNSVLTTADVGREAIKDPDTMSVELAAGDDYQEPIFVPSGKTVTVYAWGLRLTDGTTDANVVLELNTPAGTTQDSIAASAAPNYAEDTTGVGTATYNNTSGAAAVAHLRLANTGTTDYTPASSAASGVERTAAYRVE